MNGWQPAGRRVITEPPGFVTPRRARMVRVLLESEHEDAVRAGEVPAGPRPLGLQRYPTPTQPAKRTRVRDEPAGGLW